MSGRHHHKRSRHDERSEERHSSRLDHSPSHKRKKHRRSHDRVDDTRRNDKRGHRHNSPTQVKTEEEFDRRQDRARRERIKRENEGRHGDYDNRVRREPNNGERSGASKYAEFMKREIKQEQEVKVERENNDNHRRERREQRGHEEVQEAFESDTSGKKAAEKEKPNLGLSGLLTADTNTYKGVVIKYSEPPEARVPKRKWRLYPFKDNELLKILHMHRQSAYLLGRLPRIADIPVHHPSISKQHAVFQYRAVEKKINGVTKRVVRPYIIDLNSGNGTFINGEKIEPQKYHELKERDTIKFGLSTRDYVLLHDKSDTSEVASDDSASESEGD